MQQNRDSRNVCASVKLSVDNLIFKGLSVFRLADFLRKDKLILWWGTLTEQGRGNFPERYREAHKEDLKELVLTILTLMSRRNIDQNLYKQDVEQFATHKKATQFLIDFASSPDPEEFLKDKFGH